MWFVAGMVVVVVVVFLLSDCFYLSLSFRKEPIILLTHSIQVSMPRVMKTG